MKKEQKQYIGRHFNLGQYFINLYQIVFKLFLPIELISLQDYQGGIFNILIKVAFTLIVHHIICIGRLSWNEPAHEIMVLITRWPAKGHLRSLARAFTVRTHEVWKKMGVRTKSNI